MSRHLLRNYPNMNATWTSLMISQHRLRQWLGAVRQQAIITWANVDPDLCRHMASLGHNVLMVMIGTLYYMIITWSVSLIDMICISSSASWLTIQLIVPLMLICHKFWLKGLKLQKVYNDGLMQQRHISIKNSLELYLFCIKLYRWLDVKEMQLHCKCTGVMSLLH